MLGQHDFSGEWWQKPGWNGLQNTWTGGRSGKRQTNASEEFFPKYIQRYGVVIREMWDQGVEFFRDF